ncbi:MAG: cytochrome ubiquinol oxidase subunit I [Eggerthellaceae bacterium]|nr:cytochrome ubiquinol oxidase subunit I [Eggerthellaceae bacterium]
MEAIFDVTLLSRLQFAFTAVFHYFFVPLSIGLGLILAIFETKAYRSRKPEDVAAAKFWVKIFTTTFAIGVATGITMEFSFGTNWADYSRFVGDIFGAPLAAEALFAFFLESVFLGVLVFGRNKVSPKFYMIAAWLVFFGSCLSALWILIANSWMQTPAGAELALDGSKAVISDFFAAAFNPSTVPRYGHTVTAVLTMGSFTCMAVGAFYLMKGRYQEFAKKAVKIGAAAGLVSTCVLLVFAHSSAVVVAEEQPTKLAMMEGMYESEAPDLYLFGWVDEESQEVITPFSIPGGTSFLATGSFDTEFPGLNDLAETDKYGDIVIEDLPVNLVFQSYHLMVAMFGMIALTLILAFLTLRKSKVASNKWVQRLLMISPLFPFVAIQSGWITAEMGRQPWVVYPSTSGPDGVSLLTIDGVSASVTGVEVAITLALFLAIYLLLFVAWIRLVSGLIKKGPEIEVAPAGAESADAAGLFSTGFGVGSASSKGGE